jgi:hypothetical protein
MKTLEVEFKKEIDVVRKEFEITRLEFKKDLRIATII